MGYSSKLMCFLIASYVLCCWFGKAFGGKGLCDSDSIILRRMFWTFWSWDLRILFFLLTESLYLSISSYWSARTLKLSKSYSKSIFRHESSLLKFRMPNSESLNLGEACFFVLLMGIGDGWNCPNESYLLLPMKTNDFLIASQVSAPYCASISSSWGLFKMSSSLQAAKLSPICAEFSLAICAILSLKLG